MVKLLIIDGLNLVRRIYSALPTDFEGDPDSGMFLESCEKAFKQALVQHQVSHAVCVFEHYTSTWRHVFYPPYKANRKPQPQAMLNCFPDLKKRLEQLGIGVLDIKGYEADDIIASLAHRLQLNNCKSLVLSTDHLMAQLLGENIRMYDHFSHQEIDEARIIKRYKVTPHQLVDYFALVGATSVNISGIAGIGAITASKLLKTFGSIDALIDNDELDSRSEKLLEGKQEALYLYRALFRLRLDCPIEGNLKSWRLPLN